MLQRDPPHQHLSTGGTHQLSLSPAVKLNVLRQYSIQQQAGNTDSICICSSRDPPAPALLLLLLLFLQVGNEAAVLGFVGAPFTLATYIVEGGSSKNFAAIKRMAFAESAVLHALLDKLADNVADYVRYQVGVHGALLLLFVSSSRSFSRLFWWDWDCS